MKRFGYLGDPKSTSEALLTEEAVIYGLMKLQTFAGIPVTGKIDETTLRVIERIYCKSKYNYGESSMILLNFQLLNTPRCGNPDVEYPISRRSKRFVIASNGWEKRSLTYQ